MGKLESFIVDNALKQRIIEDYREQVLGVNDALERLRAEDIPCDLPTLRKIMASDEAFEKWLGRAEEEFIGKLGFLPMEERRRIKASFSSVFKRTADDRNTVGSFLSAPKYPIAQDKDGSLRYDWIAVERGAEQQATRYFSDEDVEYFEMFCKVIESLKDLEAWETKHTYTHFKNWRSPYEGIQMPSATPGTPVVINHGDSIKILMSPDFKDWFKNQIGRTLGKTSLEVLTMIQEMTD